MGSIVKSSFERNIRGFLGSSWLNRTTAAKRLSRITKSLSSDPVEPVDAVFTTVSEGYQSPDHLAGFESVTRQLLANDVLNSLIKTQSDMTELSDLPYEPDSLSAHVTHIYQHIQETFPDERPSTLSEAG